MVFSYESCSTSGLSYQSVFAVCRLPFFCVKREARIGSRGKEYNYLFKASSNGSRALVRFSAPVQQSLSARERRICSVLLLLCFPRIDSSQAD